MKTAIYIEDGTVQLVITPESEFEKAALRSFETRPLEAKVFAGTFYGCQGGWIRHAESSQHGMFGNGFASADRSLILKMSEPKTDEAIPG